MSQRLMIESLSLSNPWNSRGLARLNPIRLALAGPVLVMFLLAVPTRAADAPATPAAAGAAAQPAAAATQPAGPPAKLRCDEPEYDFKEVWAGSKVEHEFILHNDGEGTLLLTNVRSTCGCTATEYDKSIAPGSQGKVKAVLTTGQYTMEIKKSIIVTCNDPAQKTLTLTLKGKVKERITSEPRLGAYFGTLTPKTVLTKTFKLTNTMDEPMKLEVVPPTTPTPFKATIKEIEAGKVAELTITAEPPFKEDVNSAQITIKTGLPDTPNLVVPCSLVRPPAVQINPSIVRLPLVPLASPFKQALRLQYNRDDSLKVESVESSDPALKVEVAEVTPGKVYTLTLEAPQGYSPDSTKPLSLIVQTDYKERPTYTVPVIATRQARQPTTQPTGVVSAESLVGRPAPSTLVQTLDGQRIRVGAGVGEPMVINFWATWCAPGRAQTAMLDQLLQQYRRKGAQFVNISVDQLRPAEEITQVVKELDSKLPVGLDPQQGLAKMFGVSQIPTTLLVGKDGIVQAVRRGAPRTQAETDDTLATLGGQLDLLLEGKSRNEFPFKPTPMGLICPTEAVPTAISQSAGTAVMMVEAVRQEMGQYKPGAEGQYNLYFRNTGQQPLEIKNVVGTGGLQLDPNYAKSLAPGATGTIKCTFKAPETPDPFVYQVRIQSSDPVRPQMVVVLTGQAKPYIELQPLTGVDFSNRPRTHSVPRIATLVYNGPDTIAYTKVTSSSPRFQAEIRQTPQPNYAIVKVTTVPPFELGETTATIRIETNCKQQPVVEVPVKLYLPPRVEVKPATLTLGPDRAIQRLSATITNYGEASLNILSVKTSRPEIRTQFFPEPDGMSYQLQVTLPGTLPIGPAGEKVVIRTDDSEFGEIVIPIKANPAAEAKTVSHRTP